MALLKVGDSHPWRWPNIDSFISPNALESVTHHLKQNKIWSLSEKLDGQNVSVSSNGWVASRNRIIGICRDNKSVAHIKWQNTPLDRVNTLYERTLDLKKMFSSRWLQNVDFELVVYGELIVPGSGNSKCDLYGYKKRNFQIGQIFAFAIGLILPENFQLSFHFRHGFKAAAEATSKSFHIVPLNDFLCECFTRAQISHIVPRSADHLLNIINDERVIGNLDHRQKEGFVLSGSNGQGYLKWKNSRNSSTANKMNAKALCAQQEMYSKPWIAAKTIEGLETSCYHFVTDIQNMNCEPLLKTYLDGRFEELDTLFKEAISFGSYSFGLAVKETEKLMYIEVKNTYYSSAWIKFDPKVKIQLALLIKSALKKWAHPYFQIMSENQLSSSSPSSSSLSSSSLSSSSLSSAE
jgi:hypothetical protein